jgi:transposase
MAPPRCSPPSICSTAPCWRSAARATRHQEFLGSLRAIDQAVPADLEIHAILDNYATHKHPKVKAWLAARPRWHLNFIPTYSSWLNLVERFMSRCALEP